MDGLCLFVEVVVEEGEVGVVADDLGLPDGADGAHQRMVLLEIVMAEERVGFSDQVEQVLLPFFLKFFVLDYLPYALVDEVLNLGVDVLFELILQQDYQHF